MTVDMDAVDFLTNLASHSIEELEAQVSVLEQEKDSTEAESLRRKGLINKLQHQRVLQSGSLAESLEKKREEVASLQKLLSRSVTVSKTGLAFLDQATLQEGHLSPAVLQKLQKLDLAHEHVISSSTDRAAAYAEVLKSRPKPTPMLIPGSENPAQVMAPAQVTGGLSADAATPPANVTTREAMQDSRQEEMAALTPAASYPGAILSIRPSAVYGAAPETPGATMSQPEASSLPAHSSASIEPQPTQRRQLPSHITMITPDAPDAGARPMAMSAAAGTATVGGAVGVVTGLKLRPTSEFQANS